MADDNLTLMIEANRRGLLPPDQKGAFDEAVRRGLMPSSASGMDRFMMGVTDPGRGIMEMVQQITGGEAKAETPDPNAKPKDVKMPGEVISPTDPMRIAGNVANPANLIPPVAMSRVAGMGPMAKTIASATIPALMQPVGETDQFWTEKGKQGATGAALGYGFSVAGKGVSKGMEALGGWLVRRYPENIASHAVSLVLKRIEQDRAGGGLTARNMVELVRLAGTKDKPLTLSDVGGKNVERLAGNIYRSGGPASNIAETLHETRDSAAANRLRQDIAKYVHGGMTVFEATEALLTSRSAAARPLYEHTDKLQGIWSPRMAEFFKDPVIKQGMGRGAEIERMVSLAENRAFNPTAMGVDISDPNNITFLRAPNMRVLDMAKQGLDAMIADERNAITGRLSARGVALDKLRRSYVAEIDTLDTTGVYKKARAAWGGYSASLDALKSGRSVFQGSPEESAALVKSLSPSDQEFYRMGVADMLNERLAKTGFSSDEAKALIKNEWTKGQIKPAFKSEAEFNEFVDSVAMESLMFGRRRAITGGSQTAERMSEDQSELIKRAEASASIAGKLAGGHYFKAVADFYRMHKDLGLRSDPKMNEAVAKILFSPLPPHAKTPEARAVRSILSPPPPGQGNYLQGPARTVQDLIAPALASETGEISGGRPLPLPHYQEGGVSSGGQAVVGESGPEIVNLPPGSEVIPNHDIDSLLRQMGSGPAPPEAEPMTRALPGYEQRSPGELAMIRTQEATRPTRGRADITPEHLAQMLVTGGSLYAGPEALTAKAIASAPKTMTALLAALGLGTGTTEAGEKPFNWEDNNKDRTKEITAIEKRIQDRADKINQLGTTSTKSPPGTQKLAIENLQKLNQPDSPDTLRLMQLRAEQKSDREQALADEMERRQRETSLSKKHPGVFGGAALASPVFSYLTGKMPGSRIKNAAGAAAVGGLGGAVEGFGAAYAPTYLDLKLPSGADKEAAQARVRDPLYWLTEVAPIVGANALAGGLGAGRKNLSMRPKLGPQNFPQPASPTGGLPSPPTPPAPVSPPAAAPGLPAPSASPGPSKPPTIVRSGTTYELTSSGWRVQAGQPGGGRFMKKPPQWPSWLPKEDK